MFKPVKGEIVSNNGLIVPENKGKIGEVLLVDSDYTVKVKINGEIKCWDIDSIQPMKEDTASERHRPTTQVPVNEKRRQIVFTNGERLDLHNVTHFDPSGTHLRIWAEEGIAIINTDNVNYHLIKATQRKDVQNG